MTKFKRMYRVYQSGKKFIADFREDAVHAEMMGFRPVEKGVKYPTEAAAIAAADAHLKANPKKIKNFWK